MGDPCQPTAQQRSEIRALAAAVIRAVTEDERMPRLGKPMKAWETGEVYAAEQVDEMVTEMAQEIAALVENFATVTRWAESACQVLVDLGDEYEEHASGMIEDIAQLRKDGAP